MSLLLVQAALDAKNSLGFDRCAALEQTIFSVKTELTEAQTRVSRQNVEIEELRSELRQKESSLQTLKRDMERQKVHYEVELESKERLCLQLDQTLAERVGEMETKHLLCKASGWLARRPF